MSETIYDRIVALPRGDSRRQEIAAVLGCHHLSTAMLRIQKIDDPDEKARVTATVSRILDNLPSTNTFV